ncbi:MAG: hypothetical protein FWG70_12240, partial [Oscillospiraceae bacterium]|nr:hypothetical protein [Oscillospiraceae bacterium]
MPIFKRISKNIEIADNALLTVKECGNIVELRYVSRRNTEAQILRVSKDYYLRLKDGTGEALVNHAEKRTDDLQSVKMSLERLRDYINTNITEPDKCRWLTFTYAENMTDPERLLSDFRAFSRRCRKRYGHFEYITAIEPQGRGAFHIHGVFIFPKKAPYMKNSDIREMWGQG